MLVNKCLWGLEPPYLAELCQPVVELAVQRTATTIGRRNFAVSGPDNWNSLPTDLRLRHCRRQLLHEPVPQH